MKKALYTILSTIALLFATGCMHNNGDIGPWFGQWKIERIEKDGATIEDYKGDGFLRFQSETIAVVKTYESENKITTNWGNWVEGDGYMDVVMKEFNNRSDGGMFYLPEKFRFNIIKRDGKDKILSVTNDDGAVYTYYLKKW